MEPVQSYYITKLKEILQEKQKANPQYSLRAYARDLNLDPSTLSKVLKGTRPLTLKDSAEVVERLKLSPSERTLFLESIYKTKVQLDQIKIGPVEERKIIEESHHAVIAEWEHFALETLFELDDFTPSEEEIARRLGITLDRAQEVLENLLVCGLLEKDSSGKLKKAFARIRTPEDIKSQALQESHLETLEMGKQKLLEIDVNERDFSSLTVAVDPDKLPEAKIIIREFRQKMMALLKSGAKSEVYQLAIQFYPLTTQGKRHQ